MKHTKIYLSQFLSRSVGLLMVVLLALSSCVNDDSLSSDSDSLSYEDKIIMNLHLNLPQEQEQNIETRAAGIDGDEIRDIFIFLFDESGRFRTVEQSIERKPGEAAGTTKFFVAFDKNDIEDVNKFKVVVVANLEKELHDVKNRMSQVGTFDRFIKTYTPLHIDAQLYGRYPANLFTSVFYANKNQLADLTASLVRPISKFKVSLNSERDYVLAEASLYGYSKDASSVYNIGDRNQLIVTSIAPSTNLIKPIRLTGTNSVISPSSNYYITQDYMVAAEQYKDLLVVLKCRNSSGQYKYFSSRISNIEVARNKSYTINFTKLSGEGYETEAEAAVGEELSTSLVVEWDKRIREGYVRQHKYFGVGKSTVKEIEDMRDEFSTYIQTNMAFEYSSDYNNETFIPPVVAAGKEGKLQFYYVSEEDIPQLIPILDLKEGFFQTEVKQTVYLQHVAFNSDDPASSKEKFFVYKIGLAWTGDKQNKPDNFKIKMMYEGAELLEFDVTSASK